MIRTPTIVVLFIVLGFTGVALYSRHDLLQECPQFFKQPIKDYVPPTGVEDYDDGRTWSGCTAADPTYLDMQQWVFWAEISGTFCGLLLMADIAAFTLARSNRREDLAIKRGKIVVRQRRILHKISRFLGGL